MRVEAELVLHDRGEPVMSLAEVHRPGGHDDAGGLAGNDHVAPRSAAAISVMRPALVPAGRRTDTPATTISMPPSGSGGACAYSTGRAAEGASSSTMANAGTSSAGSASSPRRARPRHSDR